MQIVIDIPNWLYNAIIEHREPVYSQSLGDAVRDGTALPKGHGDLIDRKDLIEDFKDSKKISFVERMDISCIVDHAPTIIEGSNTE